MSGTHDFPPPDLSGIQQQVQEVMDQAADELRGQPADKVAAELRRRLEVVGVKGTMDDAQLDRIALDISQT